MCLLVDGHAHIRMAQPMNRATWNAPVRLSVCILSLASLLGRAVEIKAVSGVKMIF